MKKILSIFAAALFAVAVNAQTDFASPGYYCTADDAILSGSAEATKFYLSTESTPHYIGWNDVGISTNSVAKWTVTATRGCYVTVTLDLGPVVANNKHIFEVKILDAQGNVKGTVAEGLATDNGGDGYPGDYDKEKLLDGTILLPAAGDYMVELRNIRNYGKGSVKNVILTYSADAPSEIIDVTSVELNKNEVTLDLEEVELLAATVSPDNATDPTVTWESSDESVATVNENGLILAIAEGTATITAKAGEKSATCEVTVAAAAIPDVDFSEPYVLAGKVAHLEGAIWKNEDYKLYGDGGYNKYYGTAIWNINVTRPCIVSGVLNGVEGGHIFGLDLYQGEEFIGSLEQPDGKTWSNGEIALDGTLTFAAAGNYTLKLRNTQEWSSGKVAGVTLTYEGAPATPRTLYLQPNEGWKTDGARFALYTIDDQKWYDMTLASGEEAIYQVEISDAIQQVIFCRMNSATEENNWDNKWNQTGDMTIEADKNMCTIIDWNVGVWSVYGEPYVPQTENGYYLVGKFGGVDAWSPVAEKKLVINLASTEVEEYMITTTLAVGDELKIVKSENDAITWYPGQGGNFEITADYAGENKTIYFRPSGNQEAWFGGLIWIDKNDPTAIENTNANAKAVKMIENGQLIIIKNGVKYNALGTMME